MRNKHTNTSHDASRHMACTGAVARRICSSIFHFFFFFFKSLRCWVENWNSFRVIQSLVFEENNHRNAARAATNNYQWVCRLFFLHSSVNQSVYRKSDNSEKCPSQKPKSDRESKKQRYSVQVNGDIVGCVLSFDTTYLKIVSSSIQTWYRPIIWNVLCWMSLVFPVVFGFCQVV